MWQWHYFNIFSWFVTQYIFISIFQELDLIHLRSNISLDVHDLSFQGIHGLEVSWEICTSHFFNFWEHVFKNFLLPLSFSDQSCSLFPAGGFEMNFLSTLEQLFRLLIFLQMDSRWILKTPRFIFKLPTTISTRITKEETSVLKSCILKLN